MTFGTKGLTQQAFDAIPLCGITNAARYGQSKSVVRTLCGMNVHA